MNSIRFFTPVNYSANCQSMVQLCLEKVDDYFYLGGRKAQVIPFCKQGESEGTAWIYPAQSFIHTAIKIATYLTLIIPAILLVAKCILRWTHQFHLIKVQTPHYFGGSSSSLPNEGPDSPDAPNPFHDPRDPNAPRILPFDQPTDLTTEETVKLKIKIPVVVDRSNFYYEAYDRGFSDLPQYADSYFEVSVGCSYMFWADGKDEMRKVFDFRVTRRKLDREYPYMPLNVPVILNFDQHVRLKIEMGDSHFRDTTIAEYNNSEIVIFENGRDCVFTRILKRYLPESRE